MSLFPQDDVVVLSICRATYVDVFNAKCVIFRITLWINELFVPGVISRKVARISAGTCASVRRWSIWSTALMRNREVGLPREILAVADPFQFQRISSRV